MADLIDITNNILSQNNIYFETKQTSLCVPIENATFGVLNFTAITASETENELDFLFTIDCSGSMSDKCADGRSKMQHIIHTLKNMIIFIHDHPSINAHITVNTFDTKTYKVVPRVKVTENNLDIILNKVDKISPKGGTNIQAALVEVANEIMSLNQWSTTISHIFMTDGEATNGSTDLELLKSLVKTEVKNIFIGFGLEHDATLLNSISSSGENAYYFIDKLEYAGLVYGEILHGIIYKLLTKSTVKIENGLIYDFKTNQWTNSLYVGDIISEANKIYNIISANPEDCRVSIIATLGDMTVSFPSQVCDPSEINFDVHTFRQKTLSLLYEVNEFCNKEKQPNDLARRRMILDPVVPSNKELLKTRLTSLLEEIKKYMSENDLEDNKILKNLCDDIYICYRTFDTKYGTMFCATRQVSQGTQRQYTAVAIDMVDNFDNDIPNHNISNYADTPYSTLQTTMVMQDISRIYNDDDDDNSVKTEDCFNLI